jgi:serpin B
VSPYSISSALAIAFAGARGLTEEQMAETLQFSGDRHSVHRRFADFQAMFDDAQQVTLHVANSLWPQQDYGLLDTYLALIRKYYGVSIQPVDYRHATDAAQQINQWVEEKTEHKIRDLLQSAALDPQARLVLVNAIYFKGKWADPFDPRCTDSERFHVSTKKTVVIPMMNQTIDVGYEEFDGLQVLSLPYRGDSLSMIVLLPAETDGLRQLEENLSIETLDSWREHLRTQKVRIYLPRFRMTGQFQLDAVLQSMGMSDAFQLPLADFSGMTAGRDLCISTMIHRAFVEVNEEGTEAAAAPGTFARLGPREPVFRADHPFLFLIQENSTGTILFMGRVTNPKPA